MDGYIKRIFLLGLALVLVTAAEASMMNDIDVSRISEDCGKWKVGFNWSKMDEYSSSISHGDSATDSIKIATDTLIMTSSTDAKKVLKVSVITYSKSDESLLNISNMMNIANSTLSKSKVCKDTHIRGMQIDGKMGIFASGQKCPQEEPVYAAIYPVDYHLDRPGGVLEATAYGLVLSTYDLKTMESFVNSLKIEQVK
ncbi:Uncharacterised protein [uncultured archaeon]|nr:Uncharacterised protein [uncultured archaeon]